MSVHKLSLLKSEGAFSKVSLHSRLKVSVHKLSLSSNQKLVVNKFSQSKSEGVPLPSIPPLKSKGQCLFWLKSVDVFTNSQLKSEGSLSQNLSQLKSEGVLLPSNSPLKLYGTLYKGSPVTYLQVSFYKIFLIKAEDVILQNPSRLKKQGVF
ncbi:hypothetical protein PHYBLDRAFT_147787 [Phycomyces blakesleeanus NRRL 1555(-)]|uniref:Uncharacterized protein n=1 Tax=Phycomyces blakesleeanus (strain ATCC 8743b / DSM 1359 / FGSC 10004 / NBRC 33097 / NRRL 1555) TaxID=763407 RepID=A0A162WWU6_PHYB8|nr:hypothetical protein PHYBLDRAFT_147787 [Phycomyces blakesleeanus NRRL 1555(-)]OAD71285.1 hypothetical protein PHYBLDRAFT_147787 [Phycomyces blakesleeanus NRRL 1555(-)]|eukprot:XP_018289325.1 hypothetical protein PHYBLDRAFT_147787 [Phycomyces blakesleeanus NRRL 1555(-)]